MVELRVCLILSCLKVIPEVMLTDGMSLSELLRLKICQDDMDGVIQANGPFFFLESLSLLTYS